MSADTKIEWTHMPGFRGATWNPTRGCRKISPGCKHCYAETFAERWRGVSGHAYEQGFDPRTAPDKLDLPLRTKAPTCWFVNSMSDLFLEDFSDEYIAAVFGVMAAAPRHRFLVLTKRADRMRRWFGWAAQEWKESKREGGPVYEKMHGPLSPIFDHAATAWGDRGGRPLPAAPFNYEFFDDKDIPWPIPNVWLGVSVEDQATADERIPHLLATPAAVRFVSYEPALDAVDFESIEWPNKGGHRVDVLRRGYWNEKGYLYGAPSAALGAERGGFTNHSDMNGVDWLIVGGESGPGARPFDVAWARSAIEQCRAAGVPVFVKQLGARPILCAACRNSGLDSSGANWCQSCGGEAADEIAEFRNRKGADPSEWPEDLRVREWPP
jgi:protein gp37